MIDIIKKRKFLHTIKEMSNFMNNIDEELKLENQLCFYFYAASRAITRYYHPYIEEMGLTYTQYLTMLVLWETESMNARELGERLYLDSGTLTPLLKRLEEKGYISRRRSSEDERQLVVTLTEQGKELKQTVYPIYKRMEEFRAYDENEAKAEMELLRVGLERMNEAIAKRDNK